MKFIEVNIEDFDGVYRQMEESFPICERREYQEAKAVLKEKDYTLFHIELDGQKVGFISIWQLNGFNFIEHFAIYSQYRNLGYGAKALSLAKQTWKNLILEVEPGKSEIAKRRLAFYCRNGFCKNSFKYFQPAYREGEDDVELVILSYPSLIEREEQVVKEIYKKVYAR